MGIIPVSDKGSGAYEGLVIYIVTVNTGVKGFESTPEAWSRYRCSPTWRHGPGDITFPVD